MLLKVKEKQMNSKMCIMCGLDNAAGVRAPFYSMEDGSVVTLFSYREEHQSYPGRVHGGLITAMLDELGMRALWSKEGGEKTYGVTTSLETKYRKPVPYGETLLARGIIVKESGHFLTAHCSIYKLDGTLLANAEVKYLKLAMEQIAENVNEHEEMCYLIEDGINEIEVAGI